MDALRPNQSLAWTQEVRIRDIERRLAHARDFHARGKLSHEGYALLSRQLAAERARIVAPQSRFPL